MPADTINNLLDWPILRTLIQALPTASCGCRHDSPLSPPYPVVFTTDTLQAASGHVAWTCNSQLQTMSQPANPTPPFSPHAGLRQRCTSGGAYQHWLKLPIHGWYGGSLWWVSCLGLGGKQAIIKLVTTRWLARPTTVSASSSGNV